MSMSTADLIGQRFVVDFAGPEVTADLERLIREGRVGGVILFVKNVRSVSQVGTLTADLQRLAADAGLPPLLITIDQEGGLVNRLIDGFTVFPSAMALGASGRAEDAATAGRITSVELRALGVNVNHAPVLDVNSNAENPVIGIRAFGDDPADVARLGVAYIRAAQGAGVLTTAKHFPGHGATPVDSHLDLPVVTKDLERPRRHDAQWESIEAARRAAEDGTLDPAGLRAASDRIARIRMRYASVGAPGDAAGAEGHRRLAQEIADRAITLVRNRAGRIPLPAGRTVVLSTAVDESEAATSGDRMASALLLGAELAELMADVTVAADLC